MEQKFYSEGARLSVEGDGGEKCPVISRERLESFLSFLQSKGRAKETIRVYRRCLERLLTFLPDNKEICPDALLQWMEAMRTEGVSSRTINREISIVNSYLEFLGHRELQLKRTPCPVEKTTEIPTLTWSEYLRLLQTAQMLDDKRPGMLIRLFCDTGIRLCEISDVTLEAVNAGEIILDAYTKQILAYALSESLEVDFVLETVATLIKEHGVSLQQETILHSDQGSHYTSRKFVQILEDEGLRQSMSRRGNCWDNAPQESFFGHMKDHIGEKVKGCETYGQVKSVIDEYMDYYNNERYQWELAKLSPNEYYQFCVTGKYPLAVPNPPPAPKVKKSPKELGRRSAENRTSALPEECPRCES